MVVWEEHALVCSSPSPNEVRVNLQKSQRGFWGSNCIAQRLSRHLLGQKQGIRLQKHMRRLRRDTFWAQRIKRVHVFGISSCRELLRPDSQSHQAKAAKAAKAAKGENWHWSLYCWDKLSQLSCLRVVSALSPCPLDPSCLCPWRFCLDKRKRTLLRSVRLSSAQLPQISGNRPWLGEPLAWGLIKACQSSPSLKH